VDNGFLLYTVRIRVNGLVPKVFRKSATVISNNVWTELLLGHAKIQIEGRSLAREFTTSLPARWTMTSRWRHSPAAVGFDGSVARSAADVAAPVVLAVAAASDVCQQRHVTTAATHWSAAAGSIITRTTFPGPHNKKLSCRREAARCVYSA